MGVKKQMDTFFASLGEQTGYRGRLVNTPMGPFRWNDAIELWENVNNGMVMNNISFMDEFAMMDYSATDGGADIPANRITVLEFDFRSGILPSVFDFYRNSIGTFVNSQGYLDYSQDNLIRNTVFSGATATTVPTSWGAINTGSNTFSLNNKELTFTAGVSAARFFIQTSSTVTVIPGVPYTLQCKVVAVNLTGISKRLNEVFGWGIAPLAGSDIWKVNGIQQTSTYTGWTAGDLLSYTAIPTSTTNAISPRFGLGVSLQAPTVNDFLTIKEPQFEAGVNARTYIENTASYPYYGPRFTFDSVTKAPLGLLLEGRGVNFAGQNYSQTLAGFGNSLVMGATAGNTADPFGGTAAIALYALGTGGVKSRNMSITMTSIATQAVQGSNYGEYPITISVYARPNNYSKLTITDSSSQWAGATFDLNTGSSRVISGPSTGPFTPAGSFLFGTTAYTIPLVGTNGITWWRCVLALPKGNSATVMGLGFGGYTSDSTMFASYGASYIGTGVTADGVFVFGPQIELGYGASSLIPTGSTGANPATAGSGITRESDAAQIRNIDGYNISRTENSLYVEGRLNKTTSDAGAFTTVWGLYSDQSSFLAFDILTYPLRTQFSSRVQGVTLGLGGASESGTSIVRNLLNSPVKLAGTMTLGSGNQLTFTAINGFSAARSYTPLGQTMYIPSRFVLGQPVGVSSSLPYSPPNNRDNLSMSIAKIGYYNYALGNTAATDLTR
jgi:hypothetical protein